MYRERLCLSCEARKPKPGMQESVSEDSVDHEYLKMEVEKTVGPPGFQPTTPEIIPQSFVDPREIMVDSRFQPPNWSFGVTQPPMGYPPFLPIPSNSGGTQPTANYSQMHLTPLPQGVTQRCAPPQMYMAPRIHTTTRNSGGTQPTANHSHIHPTPTFPKALPRTQPQNGKKRCADQYREHPERIKDVVQMATQNAAESRGPVECKWWPGQCDAMVSTEQGALWMHLRDRHGVLDGVRVNCLWIGCSATIKSSSLVQHVKSVHLHWGVLCPSCSESFAREDALKRHLSGER
ncbi:hypothetical protein B0H11DRAFT_2396185 [Mycena galericulata]|nr:hypothetical protein B0H11DRAFT_2396185 [Mycena galericulata]